MSVGRTRGKSRECVIDDLRLNTPAETLNQIAADISNDPKSRVVFRSRLPLTCWLATGGWTWGRRYLSGPIRTTPFSHTVVAHDGCPPCPRHATARARWLPTLDIISDKVGRPLPTQTSLRLDDPHIVQFRGRPNLLLRTRSACSRRYRSMIDTAWPS